MSSPTTCPRCFGKDGAHYLGCIVGQFFERLLGANYPWQAPDDRREHVERMAAYETRNQVIDDLRRELERERVGGSELEDEVIRLRKQLEKVGKDESDVDTSAPVEVVEEFAPIEVINEVELPIGSSTPNVTLPSDWEPEPEPTEPVVGLRDDEALVPDVVESTTNWPAAIRALRQRKGWSQRQLAEQLNLSNQAVNQWESGMSRPRPEAQAKLRELSLDETRYQQPAAPDESMTADKPMTGAEAADAFFADPTMIATGRRTDYAFMTDLMWAYETLWREGKNAPEVSERALALAAQRRKLRKGKPLDRRNTEALGGGVQRTAYYGIKLVPTPPAAAPERKTRGFLGTTGSTGDVKAAVEMFLETRTVDDQGASVKVRDLHAAYEKWRHVIDGPSVDTRIFGLALPRRYETIELPDEAARSGRIRGRAGLRLLPDGEPAAKEADPQPRRPHLNDDDTQAVRELMKAAKVAARGPVPSRMAEYVQEVVAEAPPLTDEQKDKLRLLIKPPTNNGWDLYPRSEAPGPVVTDTEPLVLDTPVESPAAPTRRRTVYLADRPGKELTKEYRELVRDLCAHGFRYYRTGPNGKGKPRVVNPEGKLFALPNTPSDVKGLMASKTMLKNNLGATWLHAGS